MNVINNSFLRLVIIGTFEKRVPGHGFSNVDFSNADMIKMGVIRESDSPYASPVVVVKKKDNTNRVCVDYRKLNKLTVIDPEPMPTAEHLFQKLSGDKFFTKIDLS